MRRRAVLLLAGAALLSPHRARGQLADRHRSVGYLTPVTGSPEDELGVRETRALVEGLRALGWVDGRNMTLEHRFSGSGRARIQAHAKELVALNPDVIVAVGGPPLTALLAETRTTPIVFTRISDPLGSGFVANLAHPGGNVTGFAAREGPIAGKWLELLKEVSPHVSRALVIMEAESQPQLVLGNAVAAAAPRLGVALATAAVREIADCEREISLFAREPGGGLVVLPNAIANNNQAAMHALAARYRLPAVYSYPVFARTGGLISYGSDPVDEFHAAAGYVDKILRGEKPGDLPVQLPTKFYLAVNLKTARALGLTVPPSILVRADEVIE